MKQQYISDPMQEVFIFETSQQLEQVEQAVIRTETLGEYTSDIINEIFRIMHTIKSSAAMMLLNNISTIAHTTEDLFYFIREDNPTNVDISSLSDLVLEGIDFMKVELEKMKNGDETDGDPQTLIDKIKEQLSIFKQYGQDSNVSLNDTEPVKKQFYISADKSAILMNVNTYKAVIKFQKDCGMENIRAFTITHNLKDITENFKYIPEDIINDAESSEVIQRDGFTIYIETDQSYEFLENFFMQTAYLETLDLIQLENEEEIEEEIHRTESQNSLAKEIKVPQITEPVLEKEILSANHHAEQTMISVSVEKLDKLMNLVGEMVISEAMVTQNPDLNGLMLDNFNKSARQLRKITSELQDMVMAIRMVPLGPTFYKMNRVVRDMSKKLKKELCLDIIGENTEVDKNIIEHIGDPLMHIVRNAADHGIESTDERIAQGKPGTGTITLEAKNAGSEVFISIKDDGKGLNKEAILQKAMKHGLLNEDAENMSDREIYNLIFLPGFSTNEVVTEFSGRGVGMDVVARNIESVGGSILVESVEGIGTTITLKIPLTLAIIDGMDIRVGRSRYTLPIISIKESFRPKSGDVFHDLSGNEMIMIRGQCYRILRLHQVYQVETEVTNVEEGIMIMIEGDDKTICLFADELIGEQQVVVKALPKYISNMKKIDGLAGCTLLGDGSISLILDVNGLISQN